MNRGGSRNLGRGGGGGAKSHNPIFSVVNVDHSSAEDANILGVFSGMLPLKVLKNGLSKRPISCVLRPFWSKIE